MEQDKGLYDYLVSHTETKVMVDRLLAMYPGTEEVKPDSVYRSGSMEARSLINILASQIIKPGSKLIHSQYLKQAFELSLQGKSCLILAEHYSNMDLVNLCYLALQEEGLGESFVESLIAIAGIKLSTENALVSAFIRAYNRIVIYPSRSIDGLENEEEKEKMRKFIMPFNMASMKELTTRKYNKQMVLVFPSGTRIRPWDDSTKTGVKEIASYIKAFEYLCFININGNNLPINQTGLDMADDKPTADLIWIESHPVITSKEFMTRCDSTLANGVDKKAHIVSCVMQQLFQYHNDLEPVRQQALKQEQ
jgi:glycerol-3-phosphate O-acyltransferase